MRILIITLVIMLSADAFAERPLGLSIKIREVSQKNWTFDCPDQEDDVVEAKQTVLQVLEKGLNKIIFLNPKLRDHIVSQMNGRPLLFSCKNSNPIFSKQYSAGLKTGAAYTFRLSRNDEGRIFQSSVSTIFIPGLFARLKLNRESSNSEFKPLRVYDTQIIKESEQILHEFLHFLKLDNRIADIHNDLLKNGGMTADVVYSCSSFVYDSWEWNELTPISRELFLSLKNKLCVTCALARAEVAPFFSYFRHEASDLFKFGLTPNIRVSQLESDILEAEESCSQYEDDL